VAVFDLHVWPGGQGFVFEERGDSWFVSGGSGVGKILGGGGGGGGKVFFFIGQGGGGGGGGVRVKKNKKTRVKYKREPGGVWGGVVPEHAQVFFFPPEPPGLWHGGGVGKKKAAK